MALQRPELGSFKPGCAGDATILTVRDGQFDYVDVVGEHMTGDKKIFSEGVVLEGTLVAPERFREIQETGASRMSAEDNLKKLGLTLPSVPTPVGNYVPWKRDGNTIYLSGQGPRDGRQAHHRHGRQGRDVEQAYEHAKLVGLGCSRPRSRRRAAASTRSRCSKCSAWSMRVPEFGDQPKVINGCSDLFVAVLGERGRHARSAVGMGSLPIQIRSRSRP
jgi:enamine deaminase RidA (YjgF/YER057c/UK114 family)